MPENILKCQGLACPEPVLRVKKHLELHGSTNLTVIVDNDAAKENVTHFLSSAGYVVHQAKDKEDLWRLEARRIHGEVFNLSDLPVPASPAAQEQKRKMLILLTSPVIGEGDHELGAKLMHNFLATLPELGHDLWRVILLNGAVRLATQENPACEQLSKLAGKGVDILVCGTCLEYFGLLRKKAVGQTTNMLDVVTSMQIADSVIRP